MRLLAHGRTAAWSGLTIGLCLLLTLIGCSHTPAISSGPSPARPPSGLLGGFEDDYGIRYSITEQEWLQHSGIRYRIVAWYPEDQVLIARNDIDNPSDG